MKRLAALFILLSMVATLTGCFKERVILNSQYDTAKTTPDHSVTQIWIVGLVNVSGDNNLNQLCPNGADRVHSTFFVNLSVLGIGKAEVYCKN